MPRRSGTTPTTSRTARAKLPVRNGPYWNEVADGVSLGYRAGAGTWIVRTRKPDGKYASAVIGRADDTLTADGDAVLTYTQAVARARSVTSGATSGAVGRTVADAARSWAADKMTRASGAQARRNCKAAGERLARAFEGEKVATLTQARIEAWRDAFMAEADPADPDAVRRRRATFNRELANLKAALTRAAGAGPWNAVAKFRKADAFGARVDVLDAREIQRLLRAAPNRETRDLLELLAETGARYGEIAGARLRDADAVARTLRVTGKTGARTITLSERATALVAALVGGANDPDRYLLRRPDGARWSDGDQVEPTRTAFTKAGITSASPITYTLRHSAISRWLAAGVPVGAVAAQAGTSIKMVEGTYAKWIATDRQRWFG